jgi:hypothetical protein
MNKKEHIIVRTADGMDAPDTAAARDMASLIASHKKIGDLLRTAYAAPEKTDVLPFFGERVLAAAKAQPQPSWLDWLGSLVRRPAFAWSAATVVLLVAGVWFSYKAYESRQPIKFESFVIYQQSGQSNGFVQYFEYTPAEKKSDENESG